MVAQKLALNRQVTPPSTPIPPAPKPKCRSARDSFFATQRDEAAQSNIQAVLQLLLTPPPNKQTNRQTNKQTDRQTDRQTNKQTNKQNKTKQRNKQTNKQTNQTNQKNKQTNKQTNKTKPNQTKPNQPTNKQTTAATPRSASNNASSNIIQQQHETSITSASATVGALDARGPGSHKHHHRLRIQDNKCATMAALADWQSFSCHL